MLCLNCPEKTLYGSFLVLEGAVASDIVYPL